MVLIQYLSSILSVLLLVTQSLFAYQTENQFWSERRQSAQNQAPGGAIAKSLSDRFLALNSNLSSLPTAVGGPILPSCLKDQKKLLAALSPANGTLRKVSLPKISIDRAPVVVHIQDVHLNLEAQKNIRETVFLLGKTGAVDLVALEGATEEIALQSFLNYSNPRAVAAAADYFLKNKKISGPIHAALSLPHNNSFPRFVGVDDPIHYKANIEAYRRSVPQQKKAHTMLSRYAADLAVKKQATYSAALVALDNTVNDYRAGKISLGEYVEVLAKIQSPPAVVKMFLKAVETERMLDFKRVEAERLELIHTLSRQLNPKDMESLLVQSVAFRSGQVRAGDFYTHLKDICQKNGLRWVDFPALDAYVRYVLLTDGIDAEDLMNELSGLERAAFNRLAVSKEEREVVFLSRSMWLAEKLVHFDLTPLEWKEYAKSRSVFAGDLSSFESFYQEADARDEAMTDNLLSLLVSKDKTRSPVGVLVTGGYHASGMADRLTREGVTVISFVPKMGHVDTAHGSTSLSVFTQEKTPLEKLFVGDRLYLSPAPDQGLVFEGPLLVPAVDVLDRGISEDELRAFIQRVTGQEAEVVINETNRVAGSVSFTLRMSGDVYHVLVKTQENLEIASLTIREGLEKSIFSALQRYFREILHSPTARRGNRVDPLVVTLPAGAGMGVELAARAFRPDGEGVMDFVRVENHFAKNGRPVPWTEVRRVWAENSGNLLEMAENAGVAQNPQSAGLPTNNVGMNLGYMVYRDGVIYHKNGETDEDSPHLWLVTARDGTTRFHELRFRKEAGHWIPLSVTGQEMSDIGTAYRGPTLVQNGEPRIDPDEWDDLRHLFRLPVFLLPNFPGGQLTWAFADGVGQLVKDRDLRRKAFEGGAVRLSLGSLSSHGVSGSVRDQTFSEWGYIKRKSVDQVKARGDYFVDESTNETVVRLLPGYHPHTVIGEDKSGALVAVAVIGETNKAGDTVQGLAEEMVGRGLRNALFVGNGKDARIYEGGQSHSVEGAYTTASALLSFSPDLSINLPQKRGSGVPGGMADQVTIDRHLVRIESELRALGLDDEKVEEVLPKVRDALETGKGFIRSNDPVRLDVYGDKKTRMPFIGPLPPGTTVDDLVPVGDLDYVVAHNAGFWLGSVHVIVRTPDQRFVMLLRPWNPYAQHWTFPAGGLMHGRTVTETARHELREELGLSENTERQVTLLGRKPIHQGEFGSWGNHVTHVFRSQLSKKDYLDLLSNKTWIEGKRTELGDEELLRQLGEESLSNEGFGETMGIRLLTADELGVLLDSGDTPVVPEIHFFRSGGFLGIHPNGEEGNGRATAVRWLKAFEKVGAVVGGQGGAVRWGKAYKDFAPTIEFSMALITLLVAVGGSFVLPGSLLAGIVAPLLGAVFGCRFYKAHFLRSGEEGPVTDVLVSRPKALAMAVIYGILIGVTPFLVGFGPENLYFFSPNIAGTGWGVALGFHQFFDRKPSATNEGREAARYLIHHLSTLPKALGVLTPLSTDRSNQLLNTGPFVPDRLDQSLRRLKNDLKFRAGFLEEVGLTFRAEKLSSLQVSLLSALLSATGEPLGIIHFLGDDPDAELERMEKYSSRWVRITVVAPVHQESSLWRRTESLKTMGVHVIRKTPGVLGWTSPLLGELEGEMAEWLRSVPSSLMATVGKGIIINANEIDRLDKDSRLKSALSNVVGLADALDLFLRILQAIRINA